MTTTMRSRPRRALFALSALAVTTGLLGASCASDDEATDESSSAETSAPAAGATGAGKVQGPPDGTTPVDGGQLIMAIEAEPAGLDPTRFAFSSAGHLVASAVFDPLATLDEEGRWTPYLAESFTPNEDNTEWTIKIPEGVVFHDGTPLDAAAVAANLEAHKGSSITSAAFWAVEEVTVVDPTTVTVSLSVPFARFPALMTAQAGYIISPKMIEDPNLSLTPIGTGPFVYDSHTPDEQWTFTKNAGYWREGLPHLDAIEYRPIPDNGERLALLEDGTVDVTYTSRPQQVNDLRGSDFKVVEYASGDESMLMLNTSKPPFDNPLARQAVAYATDSAGWREERTQGVDGEANSIFAPGQPGYLEDNGYPTFDIEKAKELVAQYEAETGQPLAFSFTTQEDQDNLADAQYLTERYTEAGMDVTITSIPQVNLVATVATGAYELSRFRLFNQPEPDADSHFLRTSSIGDLVSLNFPRYDNPAVDEAINEALAATDPAEQDAAYQEVNRILAENVPFLLLGRSTWVLAADPSVNGIYAAQNGSLQTVGPKTWISELWIGR